jgi:hypothetical protein
MRRRFVVWMLLLSASCAAPSAERRELACQLAQESRSSIPRASLGELLQLSRFTPAEADARSALDQQNSVLALGVLGGVAVGVGLIAGFATNPAVDPAARNAAYGLGGGAMASLGLAWLLSYTARFPRERARATLLDWSQHCR